MTRRLIVADDLRASLGLLHNNFASADWNMAVEHAIRTLDLTPTVTQTVLPTRSKVWRERGLPRAYRWHWAFEWLEDGQWWGLGGFERSRRIARIELAETARLFHQENP